MGHRVRARFVGGDRHADVGLRARNRRHRVAGNETTVEVSEVNDFEIRTGQHEVPVGAANNTEIVLDAKLV